MQNCLKCTLFYDFTYVEVNKITQYFIATVEDIVSCFRAILTQD